MVFIYIYILTVVQEYLVSSYSNEIFAPFKCLAKNDTWSHKTICDSKVKRYSNFHFTRLIVRVCQEVKK